jgi:hypothetical protein
MLHFQLKKNVYEIYGTIQEENSNFPKNYMLLFDDGMHINEICNYKNFSFLQKTDIGLGINDARGNFLWLPINDNRILFSYPYVDKSLRKDTWFYTLHIVTLDDLTHEEINHPYKPVELAEDLYEKYHNRYKFYKQIATGTEKIFLEIVELFKKDKYYPPIIDVKIDSELLFIFLHNENETGEKLVDIFNTKTGKFMRSAYFPFVPNIIKDGFAYRINSEGGGAFPCIEKYSIMPGVYGK